ncbi:hypothetical protein TNCV_2480691 [Trichonephila clavipes]|nr:hypothetical protein TNCV_2480691 [Trichonephila clavipes]
MEIKQGRKSDNFSGSDHEEVDFENSGSDSSVCSLIEDDYSLSETVNYVCFHKSDSREITKKGGGVTSLQIEPFNTHASENRTKHVWGNFLSFVHPTSPPILTRYQDKAAGRGIWTAMAGSDVVPSGRPIFDDFLRHLWPYIGNNTANVVFQMVKRLWLIRIDQ